MRQPEHPDHTGTPVEHRDVLAVDRDELADLRDTCSVERDRDAALRDRLADERADAATDQAQEHADRLWQAGQGISRRLQHIATADLDLTGSSEQQRVAASESAAIRSTLDDIREDYDRDRATRRAAGADRIAAAADRSAAAIDRAAAAQDRDDAARDRQQAAIERELLGRAGVEPPAPPAPEDPKPITGTKAVVESRQRIADSRAALDRRPSRGHGRRA